jgi:ribosomal protein S6E (S10)
MEDGNVKGNPPPIRKKSLIQAGNGLQQRNGFRKRLSQSRDRRQGLAGLRQQFGRVREAKLKLALTFSIFCGRSLFHVTCRVRILFAAHFFFCPGESGIINRQQTNVRDRMISSSQHPLKSKLYISNELNLVRRSTGNHSRDWLVQSLSSLALKKLLFVPFLSLLILWIGFLICTLN